jgi:urease subunit beta
VRRPDEDFVPGQILLGAGTVAILTGADVVPLVVVNTGDRPIQVGSHYHLAETNPALLLDRAAARGRRLAIPAGTSVRFEPGIELEVGTVPFGGARVLRGFRGEVGGPVDEGGR